jgi:hypothetical protein
VKIAVFGDVMPSSLVDYRGFIALMMEAVQTSETSVNIHQTTRRNNPKYRHLREVQLLARYDTSADDWNGPKYRRLHLRSDE